MTGAVIFLLTLNFRLGLAALAPAVGVLVLTRATGGWVKRRNAASLQALGGLSGEIQESISNFRVIVAFNRVDYFRQQFNVANERNYAASVERGAGKQRLRADLRPGVQPGADHRARLQLLPDRARRAHRRRADRVPAVREQLLHAAAAGGRRSGRRSSSRWRASIAFPTCSRSSRTCRSCRPNAARPSSAAAVLAFDHVRFGYSPASRRAARRDVRARARAGPTRSSARPAAARRRPRR